MLEVEPAGQRGRKWPKRLWEDRKTYAVNISQTKRDRAMVTTKRE